jgi:hypothetical protein
MTSSLRRKHQTTPLNSRPTIEVGRGPRVEGRGPSALWRRRKWISVCLLQLAVCSVHSSFLTTVATAADLQWRRGRTPAAEAAQTETRIESNRVRQLAWEDTSTIESGPQFDGGQPQLRSVIVNRDDDFSAFRSAQLEPPAGFQDSNSFGQSPPSQPSDSLNLDELQRSFLNQSESPSAQPSSQPGVQPPTATADAAADLERQRAAEVCADAHADLQAATLDKVMLDIRIAGTAGLDYPYECSLNTGEWHAGRCWPETTYMWKASALCHKPLYFEDQQMERYGHSWGPCCDSLASGVHFFTRLPVLPYCMGVTPPCECIYSLGYYRPGSCAPRYIDPIPISLRGALFEAGAVVGAAAALP